jgi:D-sedoheptulose 7-phosphate isomerase
VSHADRTAFAKRYVNALARVLAELPFDAVGRAMEALEGAHAEGRRVFVVGNGGSAATASHMANDLVWGLAQLGKPGFRAMALSDNVPLITAIANDRSYAEVFAKQLEALADPGDVVVAISGSGNSPNVVRAVEVARERGMKTIGFLGMGGGKLGKMVDIPIIVPSTDYGPIEDVHMMLDHLLIAYFRECVKGP